MREKGFLLPVSILAVLVCLFCLFPSVVFGFEFFEEFDLLDNSRWAVYENSGQVVTDFGALYLFNGNGEFSPFVHSAEGVDIFPESGDFAFEISFSYPELTFWGVGIGVGSSVPENESTDGIVKENDHLYSQFGIWQDWTNGLLVYYRQCNDGICDNEGSYSGRQTVAIVPPPGEAEERVHVLRVEYFAGRYYVFVDKNTSPSPLIVSDFSDEIPDKMWFGNAIGTGGVPWTSLKIHSIKVESLEGGGGEGKDKVIFLPGLGGSWNTEALITGANVLDVNWKLTPFTRVYSDLISTFEGNGYVQGEDLFVYTYDWRDPVTDISDRLGVFIEDSFEEEDKIDLVGHILGGLVARTYEQNQANDKIDQVVTVGSPHEGTVQAYVAWAGGQIGEKRSLADVALGIFFRLQKGVGKNNWEAVEESVPVVKDIMPSFNFAYRGADLLSLSQMSVSNDFLINLNLGQEDLYPKLEALVGTDEATPGKVFLDQRTLYDQILGLWPDGSFLGYRMENGDRTVLFESAKFGDDPFWSLPETHGGLVSSTEGIDSIMNILGLEEQDFGSEENDWGDTLLFMIGSPAEMIVYGPDVSTYLADDQGIVSISPILPGTYIVSVLGQEDGVYHLLSGVLDGKLNYFEAKTSPGQDDYYTFLVSTDGLVEPIDFDGLMWLKLARDLIENRLPVETNLEEAVLNIDQAMINPLDCELGYEKVNLAIENIFLYRSLELLSERRNISGEAIDYLIEAGSEFGSCQREIGLQEAEENLREVRQLKSLVNAKLKLWVEMGGSLNLIQVGAYKKAEEMLVGMVLDLAEGNYWKLEMKEGVVKLYLQEAVGSQI
jgi:pimeloyl-ACP methyl ester carboxylesterase